MASGQHNAPSESNTVYTGFWIDWDRGKVLGATLTLRDSHAVPLLAALAILVTLAGNRSWYLCRLSWHSLLRAKAAHNQNFQEHRRKQQVVLRNSETAGGATQGLVEEWFSFGIIKLLKEFSPKDIILGMFVIGHWVCFIALGILVSQIVLGKVVVSKPLPTCGQWLPISSVNDNITNDESNEIFNELRLNKTINSDNYVRTCYPQGGSEGRVDCNKFITQSFSHELYSNISCPFDSNACMPDAKSAIILESGNMTLSQLGLNTKYGKDISIQRRSSCAVMNATVFMTKDFGPPPVNGSSCEGETANAYYSFYVDEDTGGNADIPFSLRNQFCDDYKLMSMWLIFDPEYIAAPIRPNTFTSNEVSIFLLQGLGIQFVRQQDDPWFSAHIELEYVNTAVLPEGWHRYSMDNFLNMVSCTEQYRYCSSITGQCTEYQGLVRSESLAKMQSGYANLFGINGIKQDSSEAKDFLFSVLLLESIMQESALPWSIQQRGQAALQATRYLNDGHQARLRPDQWKFELEYWFMMALARLQLEIINTIDGPVNLDKSRAANLWATEEYKPLLALCGRVKFRSPNHTSLSTLGLIIILTCSGVLMLGSFVGMCLPLIRWTKRWTSVVEWQRDDMLALLEKTKEQEFPEVQDPNVEYVYVAEEGKRGAQSPGQQENDQFDPFLMRY